MKTMSIFLTILLASQNTFAGFGYGFALGSSKDEKKISASTSFQCVGYKTTAREIANNAGFSEMSDNDVLSNMRGDGILFYMQTASGKRMVNATLRGASFSCR